MYGKFTDAIIMQYVNGIDILHKTGGMPPEKEFALEWLEKARPDLPR
jgi:hypothetical protein